MFTANKKFTDRENYKKILIDAIMATYTAEHAAVKMFYGVGGQGKTALCEEFIENIIGGDFSNQVAPLHMNFEVALHRNQDQFFITLRELLSKKLRINCTAFDLAFITYYTKTTQKHDVKEAYPWMFVLENKVLNAALEMVSALSTHLPGLSLVFKLAKTTAQGVRDQALKLSHDILGDLDQLTPAQIANNFPSIFSIRSPVAFEKNPNDKKLAIIIDHYEKLWEDKNNKSGLGSQAVDIWIRKMVDHFPPETFFVFFGRDRLKWEDFDQKYQDKAYLDQHLLNRLSDEDADGFLVNIPIKEPEIRSKIVKASAGLPFYLDLQVDIFTKLINENQKISLDKFGGHHKEILNKFYEHIADHLKETLTVLALPRQVTTEIFKFLRTKGYIGRMSNFEASVDQSFFELQTDGSYVMHQIMREWLTDNLKTNDTELLNEINKDLFDYFHVKVSECVDNNKVDSQFDTYLYNVNHHLETKEHASYNLFIYSRAAKFKRFALWDNIFSRLLSEDIGVNNLTTEEIIAISSALISTYLEFEKSEQAIVLANNALKAYPNANPKGLEFFGITKFDLKTKYALALMNNGKLNEAKKFLFNYHKTSELLQKCYEKMYFLNRAETLVLNQIAKNPEHKIDFYANLALILSKNGRYEEALSFYDEYAQSKEHMSNPDSNGIMQLRKGVCNFQLGNYELAQNQITIGLNELSRIYGDDHISIVHHKLVLKQINSRVSGDKYDEEYFNLLTKFIVQTLKESHYNPNFVVIATFLHDYFKVNSIENYKNFNDLILKMIPCLQGDYSPISYYVIKIDHNINSGYYNDTYLHEALKLSSFDIRTDKFEEQEINLETINLLKSVVSFPSDLEKYSIIAYNLPFFKSVELIKVTYFTSMPYSIYILKYNNKLRVIDGMTDVIDEIASVQLIWEPELLIQFAIFSYDSMFGTLGRFKIIENYEQVNELCLNFENVDDLILKEIISPLQIIEFSDSHCLIKCPFVVMGHNSAEATIKIQKNGHIEIFASEEITFRKGRLIAEPIILVTPYNNLFLLLLNIITFLHGENEFYNNVKNILYKIIAQTDKVSLTNWNRINYWHLPKIERSEMVGSGVIPIILSQNNVHPWAFDTLEGFHISFLKDYNLYSYLIFAKTNKELLLYNSTTKEVLTFSSPQFLNNISTIFILNPQSAIEYSKLFLRLSYPVGEEYTIIEDPEDVILIPINYLAQIRIDNNEPIVKPIVVISSYDDEIVLSSDSVLYKNELVKLTFSVSEKGLVNILEAEKSQNDFIIKIKENYEARVLLEENFVALDEEVGKITSEIKTHSLLKMFIADYYKFILKEIRTKIDDIYALQS